MVNTFLTKGAAGDTAVLGEVFMHAYYVAFLKGEDSMGFAKAVQPF
jgi:hypothetical protein